MKEIQFDFNNMMSFNIGKKHGLSQDELQRFVMKASQAHSHWQAVLKRPQNRTRLSLEWTKLPDQNKTFIDQIQRLGREISSRHENLLFLGIGGSYLGLKSAQDALVAPYANELRGRKIPKIYFEGNNLDPEPLRVLFKQLDPKKTFVVVISKSGETTETKAAFEVVYAWLRRGCGAKCGRQILAITDPDGGSLRKRVCLEQSKDPLSFRSLPLLKGVGGRFSEFNMGLLHLAIAGIDIKEVLAGAKAMTRRCSSAALLKNPAYLYASLQYLAYKKKNKPIAIMMPFCESLRSTADWYCQLLGESLGKKYERKIRALKSGLEEWSADPRRIVYVGRTPVGTRGTTDLHSIQQNNVEGENNKTLTMIRVEKFKNDIRIPKSAGLLANRSFSELLGLAQEATAWALVRAQRPNCTITLSELTPYTWGGLLQFFEIATAFEGELLNVHAFNQPGVESYKNYMYYKLNKPGFSAKISQEIKRHPLKRKEKFIV